jgi:iron complex outermembrane receptor protein
MFFVGLVLAAVIAGPSQPQSSNAGSRISGRAVDSTGAPLAAVTIRLSGPAAGEAVTSGDGRFDFAALPLGTFQLAASAEGFATARRAVRVGLNETASVDLVLWVHAVERTVVTAGKTGEIDVQATPAAVSVLRGDTLRRLEARNVADLGGRAPGVTLSQNTGFAQLTIRGIGSTAVFAGTDPSSAVYVDGVYIARPLAVLTDFLDLDRVEILRGPQGTLYGRNTVGGALNIITRTPTPAAEASARVVAGGLGAIRAEGRAAGPLFDDRITGSAAFARAYRDGYVRDLDHPEHPLGGEDSVSTRSKVLVAFDGRADLLLSGDVFQQDPAPLVYAKVLAVKPGFQVANPPDLHEVRTSTPASSDYLQYGGAARLQVRLPHGMSLTSLTAYRRLDSELTVDADITELPLTISNVTEYQHQLSQEVTVTKSSRAISWVGGIFLFDEDDRQPTYVTLPSAGRLSTLNPRVDASARALFGQATVSLTRGLSGTVGLRYTTESKTFRNSGGLTLLAPPMTPVPGTAYSYTDSSEYGSWTPRFGLQFEAGPSVMTYVSAARGFKSGGFNIASPVAGRGFAPERAWSYETGVKSRLAGGRALVNVSAFVTDYRDLQVQTAIAPGVIDISNAAEATIGGVEIEVTSQSGPLQMGGHLAWLDATYDRYIAVGVGGVPGDAAGHRLNNAPEWSGRAWVGWERELPGGRLSARAESSWQSTVYFTPFNDDVQRQTPYGLVDVSIEFRPRNQPWSIGAFARNLTDEDYITGTFSSPPPAIGGRPGESRRAGIQFSIGYERR